MKKLFALSGLLAATTCFASDLQYNEPDPVREMNRHAIRELDGGTRLCISQIQKQMLKQGIRNTEQIVDQSVIFCGKSLVSFMAREPSMDTEKAIYMVQAIAYEELKKIPGVSLPKDGR